MLIALSVLTLCVVVVVSLVGRLLGRTELVSYDSVAQRMHDTHWSDGVVLGAGMVAAVIGLLLLLLAALPGRPVVVALDDIDGSAAGISRRSLRAALRREAGAVHGVDKARIRLGRKQILVSARTARAAAEGVDSAMGEAMTRALERVSPNRPTAVRTRLRSTRKGES